MRRNKHIYKKVGHIGFTLAEVLVTLAIIGVVAALTIPSLIQSVQDSQYKAAFKKAYSNLSNVTNQILDNDPGLASIKSGHDAARDEYGKYLSFAKKCDWRSSMDGVCWSTNTKFLTGGARAGTDPNRNSIAVLPDGTFLRFSIEADLYGSTNIGSVDIDVNGFKGPNAVGKDIYIVVITQAGIKPVMSNGYYGCDPNGSLNRTYAGEACSSLVLTNTDY